MNAMVNVRPYTIVNVPQGSSEWLAWRIKNITATDSAVIRNVSPYKSVYRLFMEKSGRILPDDLNRNPFVILGKIREDVARRKAEGVFNDILLPICASSVSHPYMVASFDGLKTNAEPTEFKCLSESAFLEVMSLGEESGPYKLYYFQVQHQIFVSGSQVGYLCFLSPFDFSLKIFEIPRNQALIDELLVDNLAFHKRLNTKSGISPDPLRDFYIPEGNNANIWSSSATRLIKAKSNIDKLNERLKLHQQVFDAEKSVLINQMGDFLKADAFGVSVSLFAKRGHVNYDELIQDLCENPKLIEELKNQNFKDQYRKEPTKESRITLTGSIVPRGYVDDELAQNFLSIEQKTQAGQALDFF